MNDQSLHLHTLQNLCVIAKADGELAEAEKAWLQQVGEGMGLEPTLIAELLAQADELDFSIPLTEADCMIELRMVVAMIYTDGNPSPAEYKACQKLAKRMNIDQRYLDEVIEFYAEKQVEHQRHLDMFQNLFLVAVANGQIEEGEQRFLLEVAHNLGLSQKDIDYFFDHYDELDFVIPEDPAERLFSLKNLVYMMIVDGEIDEAEYAHCLAFAERIGCGTQEIDQIIIEYQQLQQERLNSQREIERANLDIHLDVYQAFSQIELPHQQVATHMQTIIRTGQCIPLPDATPEVSLAFFHFLWLMYVRCVLIAPESVMLLQAYVELAERQGNFKHLRDFLMQNEQTFGGSPIELPHLSLRDIQLQINHQLEQWHRTLPPEALQQLGGSSPFISSGE